MRHLQFSFKDGALFLFSSCSSSLHLSQFTYFQTDELKHNCRNPQMDVTLLRWYHHFPFSVKKFSPFRIALFFFYNNYIPLSDHIHPSTDKYTQICFYFCYFQFINPQLIDEVITESKVYAFVQYTTYLLTMSYNITITNYF